MPGDSEFLRRRLAAKPCSDMGTPSALPRCSRHRRQTAPASVAAADPRRAQELQWALKSGMEPRLRALIALVELTPPPGTSTRTSLAAFARGSSSGQSLFGRACPRFFLIA
jgi:hypothetical protein